MCRAAGRVRGAELSGWVCTVLRGSAALARLRQLLGGQAAVPPLHEALTANLILHASLVLPARH